MACMAASHPYWCPAQTWREPAASCMSLLIAVAIALLMMRRAISPIPIGRTPGHLSSAMSRQATKGHATSTYILIL